MTVGINDKKGRNRLVNKRWAVYFEEFLNIVDDSVPNISLVGSGLMPVCHGCNVDVECDEINWTVRRLKGGKSPGIDEIAVE